MSKLQNRIYQSYEQEIIYLQKRGNKLLQQIKQQEIKMNKRKQQKLKPLLRSLYKLNQMIKKLLLMLAFIDTYGYFQLINQPLSDENENFFYQVGNQYYEDILQRFVLRLKALQEDRFVDFVIIRNKAK